MRKTIQVDVSVKDRVQNLKKLKACFNESEVISYLLDFYDYHKSFEVDLAMELIRFVEMNVKQHG